MTGHPQCPRWHRTALGVGWAGNIVLLGAVVAMGVWGNFKGLGNDGAKERTSYGYNCSTELKDFPFCFKQFLCEPPSSNSRGHPQCPHWHRMALGVGWAGNIVLLGAVVVMGVWGNFKGLGNDGANERTSYGYNCSTELKDFPFCFKQFLCEPPSSNSSEGSGCKLCPPNWLLHRDKCYWVSKEKAPWNKSRDDCAKRRARLLMIRDQDEMAFIQTTSKDTNQLWLGLTLTFPARKRIWMDGSLLNQTLFKVVDPAEGNSCGVIKADQIHFETCSAVSKWICEKDALLI